MTTQSLWMGALVGLPKSSAGRREAARLRKFVRFCAANLPIVAIVAIWAIEDSASYVFSIAAEVVP
jgi:hypothetical protein